MKLACNTFKYENGVTWFGMSIGGSIKKGERQLNLQLDLFKLAIIFSIQEKNLTFVKERF